MGLQLAHPRACASCTDVISCGVLRTFKSRRCQPFAHVKQSCCFMPGSQTESARMRAKMCQMKLRKRSENAVTSLMRSSGMPRTSLSSDTLAHCPAWLLSLCSLTRLVSSTNAWSTCSYKGVTSKTRLRGEAGIAGVAHEQILSKVRQHAHVGAGHAYVLCLNRASQSCSAVACCQNT